MNRYLLATVMMACALAAGPASARDRTTIDESFGAGALVGPEAILAAPEIKEGDHVRRLRGQDHHLDQAADLKIDTTRLNLYQLRDTLKLRLLGHEQTGTAFLVESFGFKRGMPVDADLVFDARCLPNPYWKPELRDYSGLDQPVVDYLAAQPEVEEMYQDILAYLEKWLPRFAASNRAYVTIAIGCTGGHHRSVYLAERLGLALKEPLKNLQVRHRDLA